MGFGARPRPGGAERPDYRAIAWMLVSAGGLAACITLLFLGMRAVMDIGGACASGGPFVPVQPCPDGVPALMTIGVLGLFALGGVGLWAGARVGGAWALLPLLAWPGLFLSLGWNFLEYGISPPGEEGGTAIGWLFCGIVFVLMGAVPLWIGISARNELREEDGGQRMASRFGMPAYPSRSGPGGAAEDAARGAAGRGGGAGGAGGGGVAVGAGGGGGAGTARSPEADPDFVASLERLAELRRRGDLSSEEFEAAKLRLLAGDR